MNVRLGGGSSHVMIISTDGKRETAGDILLWAVRIRALKRTTCKHRLLRTVKRDGAEFLPVANELIFDHYFMNSKLTLLIIRYDILNKNRLKLTSRNESIGTSMSWAIS